MHAAFTWTREGSGLTKMTEFDFINIKTKKIETYFGITMDMALERCDHPQDLVFHHMEYVD